MFLLKSHTETALSHAAALHARGAGLQPLSRCAAAQDKVLANQRLAAAGVRVPETWVTGSPGPAATCSTTALVVKPVRGHRGAGVHVVRTPRQLDRLPDPGGPVVVQRHVDGPGSRRTSRSTSWGRGCGRSAKPFEREPASPPPASRCR